ncbi:protein-lysine N-methyltransferase mettl10 [Iris pallida]|uniref:Protein-lysine N-methyltransferase mettl10 n=1 Tax=Iris pallida TaxID=29817 RepID=A0AAX6G1X6_IRIPA|nr:protein-lysine N-methyltransferase mettl10 [Iris pallida]
MEFPGRVFTCGTLEKLKSAVPCIGASMSPLPVLIWLCEVEAGSVAGFLASSDSASPTHSLTLASHSFGTSWRRYIELNGPKNGNRIRTACLYYTGAAPVS